MPQNPRLLRPTSGSDSPASIPGLALWLDAAAPDALYTTDAGPVTAVGSPRDISGCVLWLDGADLSSLKQNSDGTGAVAAGDPIGYWQDKSASAAHVTGSGTARPTLTANAVNGRSAPVFNGSSTNLSKAGYTATNSLSGMTRIAVCGNLTNTLGAVSRVFDGGSDFFCFMNGAYRSYVASGNNLVSSTTFSSNNLLPVGLYADRYANSAIEQYGGGARAAELTTGTLTATTGGGNPTLHIGSNIGAGFFWNGPIAEYIIFNRALTRAELASVEAYLAAKWGFANVHAPAVTASQPVGYWRDRSGNGRHATQSTATRRGVVGAQNSRRAVTLDGTDDHLAMGNLAAAFPTAAEIAVAYTTASDVSYNLYQTANNDTSDAWTTLTYSGAFRTTRLAGLPVIWPTGNILYGVSASSASHLIRLQGANVVTAAAGYSAGTNHAIGSRTALPDTSTSLNGSIAEVVAYSRVLTDAERSRLYRYLARKWGITLAPQVSNAEAQDWINRVYANGGTVSTSTASAVSTFCDAVASNNLRDRFFRLNLFCGSGLNAALVPLYRGPTFGGTTYGNATDTNNAFVGVGTDYAETGASGGLTGNGTSKYLLTGLTPSAMPSLSTGHLSVYAATGFTGSTIYALVSSLGAGFANNFSIEANRSGAGSLYGAWGEGGSFATLATPAQGSGNGHTLISRTESTVLAAYRDGVLRNTSSTSVTPAASSAQFGVFHHSNSGGPLNIAAARLGGYSIGASLDATQAAAFYTAMQAFQTALGRNV